MSDIFLRKRLKEICQSGSTLLWLEGAKHETVHGVKLSGKRLILELSENLTKVITFERYTTTKVGLQFWSQNYPGVLYQWDQVPVNQGPKDEGKNTFETNDDFQPDDEPPPNIAA